MAAAKSYYVSPHGHDDNPGNDGQPWKTLQHAVDLAQPGDTIFLKAGSYREEVHLRKSGAPQSPITISATPGEAATVLSLVAKRGVSHLRLKDFVVTGYRFWGIELSGDNHHIHLSGLRIQGGEAGLRLTVGNSGQAPQFGEVSHNTVAYNMWAKEYGGRTYGATFGYPEPEGVGPSHPQVNLTMHHNIFAFNTGPAHGEPTGIYLGPGVRLQEEHDNVFFSRPDAEIFLAQKSRDEGREVSREDIAKGAWARLTGQGKGDLAVNPRFVSGWPKVDLLLQPGSSAAGRGAY